MSGLLPWPPTRTTHAAYVARVHCVLQTNIVDQSLLVNIDQNSYLAVVVSEPAGEIR